MSRRSQRQCRRGRRRLKGVSQLFQATPASSQLVSRTHCGLVRAHSSQPHLVRPHLVMGFQAEIRHGWGWRIGNIWEPDKIASCLDVVDVSLDEAGVV